VRQWIAGGAVRPAAAMLDAFAVTATVPAEGETVPPGGAELRVAFGADVDASLLAAGTVHLIDADTGAEVRIAAAAPVDGNARAAVISLAVPLAANARYRLVISGGAPVALADTDGHVLDGDRDGAPGGDFILSFGTSADAAP